VLPEEFTFVFWTHFAEGNTLYRSLFRGPKDYMVLIENNTNHQLGQRERETDKKNLHFRKVAS
jgi:hypothetical protein